MAQQFFEVGAGLLIDETGAIITGSGIPGSGTNDSSAQAADVGTIYIRTGAGNAQFYQKITGGATTADWTTLAVQADVDDVVPLRTLTGTSTGDVDLGTFTGNVIPDNVTIKAALQAAETYAEATRALVGSLEWQNSVLDRFDPTGGLPGSPTVGDRYLATATANGFVENNIYEWDGAQWVETVPTVGTFISADDEPNTLYLFNGTSWDAKAFENTTASTGLVKIGNDIQLDASSAGNGLTFTTGVLSVNVDDVTIELSGGNLQVKADGINDTHIDFGIGANQVNAADIPLLVGTGITATDVDSALIENRAAIDAIEDNTITSPNGSIAAAGTVGADDQTVDVVFSTTGEANRSIEAAALASTANGEGASMVGIEDAAGNFTATDVEGALLEIDGRLDAVEGVVPTQVNALANTGGTTITADSVLVDEVVAITWHVMIEDLVSGDREYLQVSAIHDGSANGITDATQADYTLYSKLRLTNVSGDQVSVDLDGTGAAQVMRLRVVATNNFDVRVIKSETVIL